jgi:hypothetical protein
MLHMNAVNPGVFNSEYSRAVEVPSANGLTNARALGMRLDKSALRPLRLATRWFT